MPIGMPKTVTNPTDRMARKQYQLVNKAGGMGRYGMKGPAERLEEREKNREKYLRRKRKIKGT